MEDKFEEIVATLSDKAALKQHIHRSTVRVFQMLKTIAADMEQKLSERVAGIGHSVQTEFTEEGEFEFQLKLGEDVLMFSMLPNILTLGEGHVLSKSAYIQEDPHRGFFGMITIYNFMADSVRYNRLNDAGYLLARMMVNGEDHYYIEGIRQLYFMHPDIGANVVNEANLRELVQSAILLAVEEDLQAPTFQDIQVVPLSLKLQDQMAGTEKVGFQMKMESKKPS
ncbi:MAG: hypothetical protein RLZZ165_2066 [Bacteroidota bacterium]|jgi:hypothetical protein